MHPEPQTNRDYRQFAIQIKAWAVELGFADARIGAATLPPAAEAGLAAWLVDGCHGEMDYMARHAELRAHPQQLHPGTITVISAALDYLPHGKVADDPGQAAISRYAQGRDYHKVIRSRLQKLAERIAQEVGPLGHRAFTDSAPVMEAELARRSGQGWRGKHTLVLNRDAGSTFFLGEIYVDMALPETAPVTAHCGSCQACMDACPTQAIVAPHRVDARRCISYLTIEYAGPIPLELRTLMGNRIYGCDDCQLVCPWNKFAQVSRLPDFDERKGLSGQQLVHLFAWDEPTFLRMTEGGPIRRIGHERWLRNVAVALGNALRQADSAELRSALQSRAQDPSELVREHVAWALAV